MGKKPRKTAIAKLEEFNSDAAKHTLDLMPLGVNIVDEKLRILYLNKFFLKIFGKKAIGKKCFKVYKKNKQQCSNCPIKKPIKIGQTKTIEVEGIAGNRTYRVSHTGIRLPNGKKGILEVFHDITDEKAYTTLERKQTEIKKGISRFKRFSQVVFEGVLIHDRGKILDLNNQFAKIFGYSKKELLGKNALQLIAPKERDAVLEKIRKEFEKPYKTIGLKKNGTKFLLQIHAKKIKSEDKIIRIAVCRDITKEKKAEEELKKSEMQYRHLIENIPDVTWTTSKQGKTVFISPNIKKVYGFTQKEIYKAGGKLWFGRIHPKDLKKVKKAFANLFSKGKNYDVKYRIKHKNGNWIWLYERSLQAYKKGKEQYVDGIFSDITKRKNADIALKKEKEFTDKAINAQTDTFFAFNSKTGKAIRWNKNFSKVSGYSDKKIAKMKAPNSYYSKKDLKKASAVIKQILKTGSGIVELSLITKTGKRIPFEYKASLIKSEENKPLVISIGRDITERKKADEEVKKSQGMLKLVLESIPSRVFWKDLNCVYLGSNEIFAKDAGMRKSENLVGKTDFEMNWKKQAKLYRKDDKQVMESGKEKLFYEELQIDSKGNKIWLRTSKRPLRDINEKIIGIIGVYDNITEKKKAEEALKESEEKFRTLFNNSKDALMTLEPPSWKFTSGNPSIIKMFGVKDEKEFTTLRPWEISPKYQPDGQLSSIKAKKMIKKALKKGTNFFEWTHKKISGEDFYATILLNKITLNGKNLLQATVRDISDRKKAEEKIKKLASISKYNSEVVNLTDLNGRMVFLNRVGSKILGINPKKINNHKIFEVIPDKFMNTVKKELIPTALKKGKWEGELAYKNIKTGKITDVHTMTFTIKDENTGKPIYLANVSRDITEKKKTEENLRLNQILLKANINQLQNLNLKIRESEEKYRSLVESASDMIFMISPDKKVLSVNKAAAQELKQKPEKIVEKSIFELFPKKLADSYSANLDIVFKTGKPKGSQTKIVVQDKISWISVTLSPIKGEKGKTIAVIGLAKNITEQKKAEETIKNQVVELQRLDKAKDEFLSAASHELKTPLTSMMSFTESLAEGKIGSLTEPQQEIIETMLLEEDRLKNTIGKVLETSKIKAKGIAIRKVKTSIQNLMKEVIESMEIEANNKEIKIVKDIAKTGQIILDSEEIFTVVKNLLENAIKFSRIGGEVRIIAEKKGNNFVVEIRDFGTGISKANQKKLFTQFFQAEKTVPGTGLGLSICKQIIDAHKGKIWVKSKLGKGSSFYFSIPFEGK